MAAAGAATSAAPAAQRWVLTSLALCMLLPSLGTSIANVALPTLANAFDASFQQVQWVVLAYLLASTTLIVGIGRLGDLLGRRRLLLAGILLFALASGLCGMASGLGLLIAARVAQGLGAAVMMALTMALVGELVPKARAGSAMGLLGTMSALGTALGPTLGGLLIASFGWRAIFLLSLPLAVLAGALVSRHLPADRHTDAERPHFDPLGTLLLGMGLAAYALAMTLGRGHFGLLNLALLGAAALAALLFAWVETHVPVPLLRLAMLREPRLRTGLASNALVATVMMATLVVGPFYLSQALGLDSARLGLAMSVGPAVAALSGLPAGRGVDRFGAPAMAIGGLFAMLLGCAGLGLAAALPAHGALAGYLGAIAVTTAGYAVFQAANNTALMADVAPAQRGLVSGLVNLARNLGLITGASLMGAVFAHASRAADLLRAAPGAIATGAGISFAVAAGLVLLALLLTAGRAGA